VGKNQKVAIARTMEHTESAISSLFFGRFRSLVRRPRAKDSVTTEPFHCIGLEILDDGVKSLEDALAFMTKPELIDAKITKTLRVEIAPPILVLQFKRFVYTQSSGIEKLNKFISYPEKLTLDVEGRESTTYRLFSVIYHHGRSANGGHYTCHVRHGQVWVSYDDATMMIEPLERVLMEKATWQTAYLLFYVRNSTRRR
jgi:ubiquitin carboxyl-terminal hydrolase 10